MLPEVVLLSLMLLVAAVIYFFTRRADSTSLTRSLNANADLIKVVLSLEQARLEDLFKLYRQEFGAGAARYARSTYNRWKSGEVRPNRQTFNRFLMHLPDVMSFDLKCEVLRKLRQEYCSKDHYKLTVDTANWKEKVAPLVTGIINKSYTAELPKHIEGRLRWLSADDMQVARAILAESQAQESKQAMLLIGREFINIEQLLRDTKGRGKITHTIKLPLGTITLRVNGRR
jgi:hypothetical protein